MVLIRSDVLRTMSSCIKTTETSNRLTIMFHSRWESQHSARHFYGESAKVLTPPVSTFVMKTNINWYLYTQEPNQKTTAPARATSGAKGAKTSATVAMKSYAKGQRT